MRPHRAVVGASSSANKIVASFVVLITGAVLYTNVYLPNFSPAADAARERAGAAEDAAYARARGSTWSNMAAVRDRKQ
jgi:hypothetical protein